MELELVVLDIENECKDCDIASSAVQSIADERVVVLKGVEKIDQLNLDSVMYSFLVVYRLRVNPSTSVVVVDYFFDLLIQKRLLVVDHLDSRWNAVGHTRLDRWNEIVIL